MTKRIILGAAAAALAVLGVGSASAQPGWAPPGDWGTGWHQWNDHHMARRGWDGPGWYNGPGEHHGWYQWNGGWYQHCGWRWGHRHHRSWRCY